LIDKPTFLIADDHPILRNGLTEALTRNGYDVIASLENGSQALEQIVKLKPSLAILDIQMPFLNGFEVVEKAIDAGAQTKFLILTSHQEKAFINNANKLKINGYLLKDEPFEEIEKAIQTILNGASYFSPVFGVILTDDVSPELKRLNLLSSSEKTILDLVSKQKSSKEIAKLLFISPRTVEKHRSNIGVKLELKEQEISLIEWLAMNKGLV
jgi:DNA-binding NarL/FixJ family response regulator